MNKYKTISLISMLVILLSFYITWTILVLNGNLDTLDNNVLSNIVDIRGEKYESIYWFNRIMTETGYTYAIIVILFIVLVLNKFNLRSIAITFGVIVSTIFNEIIKKLYGRERPIVEYRWMEETSKSYPSGHSNVATTLYGLLIYLIIKSKIKKGLKILLISICIIIPISVYTSRIFLSVHFLSDVIGGITNGLFFVTLTILIIELLEAYTEYDGFKPYIENKFKKE